MKIKTKLFGVLAALALLLPLGVGSGQVVKADENAKAPTEQTIEIHKLIFDKITGTTENTGSEMNFEGSKPLSGAGFTAYDVTKEYWVAYTQDKTNAQAAALAAVGTQYGGESAPTDEKGITKLVLPTVSKIINGQNAVYKIVETTTPAGADDQQAVAFIVGLPVYDDKENLLAPIKVYPKNEYRTSKLEFTKYGVNLSDTKTGFADETALGGAKFIIKNTTTDKYYNVTDNSFNAEKTDASALISGGDGKVSVPGLILADGGKYEIYEIDSDVSKQNPDITEGEIFHYTQSSIIAVTAKRDTDSKLILTYTFKDKAGTEKSITATPTYKDGQVTYTYVGDDDTNTGVKVYNYKVPEPTKKADDNDLDIGQKVTFTITQLIPNDISGYTQFNLVDTYDSNLALISDEAAILSSVKIDDKTVSTVKPTYTHGENTFILAFNPRALDSHAGETITFTVDMKLKPGTNLATGVNNIIKFDNNFTPKTDKDTIKTYGHSFVKKDLVSGKTLQGAEFVIKSSEGFLVDKDGEISWTNSQEDATVLISDVQGKFSIAGLAKTDEDGEDITYQLVETKAPEGYVLPKNSFEFVADNGETEMKVDNKSKGTLPSTGGKGIYAFIAIGAITVAGATLYFVSVRKQTEA
ncbi:TPA: SpaH/EbpB family LPXTG-anchored major pilin [Enterococcus faecalis]